MNRQQFPAVETNVSELFCLPLYTSFKKIHTTICLLLIFVYVKKAMVFSLYLVHIKMY